MRKKFTENNQYKSIETCGQHLNVCKALSKKPFLLIANIKTNRNTSGFLFLINRGEGGHLTNLRNTLHTHMAQRRHHKTNQNKDPIAQISPPEITKNGAPQGIESQHQGRNRRGRGRIGSRRFVPLRLRAVLPFPSAKPQGEKEGSAGLLPFLQQGSPLYSSRARVAAPPHAGRTETSDSSVFWVCLVLGAKF